MKLPAWLSGILIFLFALGFWSIPMELGARYWTSHWADPLQRARAILAPDGRLGWRQRANLKTTFEGAPLRTDSYGFRRGDQTESHPTILVLGPSSAFGWGVKFEETWATRLQHLLPGERVLNASEIGYSLVQGRRLYQDLKDSGFDLSNVHTVILAYGVNDIDRFHFYGAGGSDEKYFQYLQPGEVRAEAMWSATAISSLLFRAIQEARPLWDCSSNRSPQLRVSFAQFAGELRSWAEEFKAEGKRVILVNSARQLPFAASLERAAQADELFRQGAEAAVRGDCAGSRRMFKSAKENESRRVLRDIDRINQIVAAVGAELKIPVAEVAESLVSTDPKKFFVDPIHPSAEGHARMADLIAKLMQ